ncbi:putative chitinase [Collimonas sp. PA-H2]|nr:putative chitinase [Collimonas sp. PA-H2]
MHLQAWNDVKDKKDVDAVNFLKKFVAKHALTDKDGKPVLDQKKHPKMVGDHVEILAPVTSGACVLGTGYERVQRGDILGYCGSIPDNMATPSRGVHFEILFEDVQFLNNSEKLVWGECQLAESLLVQDELLSKQIVKVDPKKPLTLDKEQGTNGYKKIHIEKQKLWVSDDQIATEEIEIPDPKHKGKKIAHTQHQALNKELHAYVKDPVKNVSTLAKDKPVIPWMDPWLASGEFQEEINEGKTWVQVFAPDTNKLYWAEKNTIKFSSDADWPDFQKIEEHGQFSDDGFIDDDGLQKLLDGYDKDRAEKNKGKLAQDEDKLRHLVTKHPTEWSKLDIAKRFGRVTNEAFGPSKLTPEQFAKLTKHIERLAFWEDIPGLPNAKSVWHVHPVRFVEQLAKCMWLSKNELAQIYPAKASSKDETISHGTTDEVREKYRLDINKCCFRYAVNNRIRCAHFFGQGAVESGSLNSMLELASGTHYEGSRMLGNTQPGDGPKFKGRGFKQLTGRYNYGEYWAFKGWLKKGVDFDTGWENDAHKRFPPVADPDRILATSFTCIDAGCWYITLLRKGTLAAMDKDDVKAVTHAINGGENGLPERINFTTRIKKVLL